MSLNSRENPFIYGYGGHVTLLAQGSGSEPVAPPEREVVKSEVPSNPRVVELMPGNHSTSGRFTDTVSLVVQDNIAPSEALAEFLQTANIILAGCLNEIYEQVDRDCQAIALQFLQPVIGAVLTVQFVSEDQAQANLGQSGPYDYQQLRVVQRSNNH